MTGNLLKGEIGRYRYIRKSCKDEDRDRELLLHTKESINTKPKVASKLPGTRGQTQNRFFSTALKRNNLDLGSVASRGMRQQISAVPAFQYVVLCYSIPSINTRIFQSVLTVESIGQRGKEVESGRSHPTGGKK